MVKPPHDRNVALRLYRSTLQASEGAPATGISILSRRLELSRKVEGQTGTLHQEGGKFGQNINPTAQRDLAVFTSTVV